MKDIFKLRVYSPVQETLAEVAKIDYEQNMVYDVNGEGFNIDVVVLNQCTGVKDMDGKLIYVGDILKIKPFIGKHCILGRVERSHAGSFGVDGYGILQSGMSTEYKVIGNIYDNRELLECQNG